MAKYAITGLAGSGKDTVGKMIADEFNTKTYALAEPIYQLVSRLFDVTIERMQDRAFKEKTLLYKVDVTSLEDCGMYFNEVGLDTYQMFHDAWEEWIELFGLKEDGDVYSTQISIRKALQLLGTEWGRSKVDTMWLDLAPANAVITDVRFDNEAEYFIAKDYTILEVVRPGVKSITESSHASENGISQYLVDTTIYNDDTLKTLNEKVLVYMLSDSPQSII